MQKKIGRCFEHFYIVDEFRHGKDLVHKTLSKNDLCCEINNKQLGISNY